ncbi:hypothetical protein [Sphaerochaeta sp. PS]|uniref:hypothetical protein n=1 Tax=Sphaerochaeta sp. PS TaxID=3076336 RepID=UPI0028A38E0F|nr:hypothetical protein [Sphaerochaeta sp. PS]MDT4761852.1 hypothetical protein [Sphaerochaeta sp. PS]
MFKITSFSPLQLKLDEKNPRFKVSVSSSQKDIREYMLINEDLISLSKKINDMGVLLPGERIVVVKENNENIVLEGNRRTAIYQMFLDRKLVPKSYERIFPHPSAALLDEITTIPIDLVESREQAMPYLAARHIEGVKQWSSVSKWRISYDYYIQGKSSQEIADILMLSSSDTKKFICNYKILNQGISSNIWKDDEKKKLTLLTIEPDKLIRILRTREATSLLNLSFDDDYNLVSNTSYITKQKLDKIIVEFTRKAFIDNTLNTRSSLKDKNIKTLIEEIIPELKQLHLTQSADDSQTKDSTEIFQPDAQVNASPQTDSTNKSRTLSPTESSNPPLRPSGKQLPYFFEGLDPSHLDRTNQLCHGLIQICKEIAIISRKRMIEDFPICGAFLTRSLLEYSIKYYSQTHKILNSDKFIWQEIATHDNMKLSVIIERFCKESSISNYVSDKRIQEYFINIFSDYNLTANPLNWVVHDPSSFLLSSESLIMLPRHGLLAIINYFIA